MSAARDEVLRRIRAATADVPRDEAPAWAAEDDPDPAVAYRRAAGPPDVPACELFAERVADFRATVTRTDARGLPAEVAEACARHRVGRLAVPADLPAAWVPRGLEVDAGAELTVADLDAVDGVLTGCATAIAETGTIILDAGPGQGPRRLTLVPDLHICVVLAAQVAITVPEALHRVAGAVRAGRPLTLVSGPSATSDIELDRVEGVHGPRRLEVIVVG